MHRKVWRMLSSTSRLSCPASGGASSNPARRLEAKPCEIRPAVFTGSSACADDDDRQFRMQRDD
jgi:hypothetical protein